MMKSYREVLTIQSDFWEACARHQNRATTRFISSLFLCDACAIRLTRECFNNRPPIFHGQTLEGYCGLCGRLTEVTLRQWFICPICLNVVYSYPKSFAATSCVHKFWREEIQREFPAFKLQELDVVQIEPFIPGRRSRKRKVEEVEVLDFLAIYISPKTEETIFHIELKTGPGSPEEMREFQLDVNDFEDMTTVAYKTGLPIYIFHVQVTEEYKLPTHRSIAQNLWWTDIFSLREGLKSVRRRRGEDKDAGYYAPSVFRPKESFAKEIATQRYVQLRQRLLDEGIRKLPARSR